MQFFNDQVQIGAHSFTFDHVYGNGGSPSANMFEECVAPLVDGLFQGYNATVLAYGQVRSTCMSTTSWERPFYSSFVFDLHICHRQDQGKRIPWELAMVIVVRPD